MEIEGEMEKIIRKAVDLGVSYIDVRYQRYDYELITVENRALKSYSSRRLSGAGIRVALNGTIGYASTSNLTYAALEKTLENAIKAAKSIKKEEKQQIEAEVSQIEMKSPYKIDTFEIAPEEKVSAALDANKAAWINEKIKSAMTRLGISKDYRFFMSSEGSRVITETNMIGIAHESIAKSNGIMERVPYQESKCAGYEFISSMDLNKFTEDISRLAVEAVESRTPPAGTYTVVVDPNVIGLLLHEAFGHASEGDLVSTRESVLYRKIGSQVASKHVTIIDEGVIEGGYFYPYDDEGVKKEKTFIVENGILKSYLHNRTSAYQFNVSSTGNGRAQDFENTPIVRQTNYYMEPRNYNFEELIEDVNFGIYIRGKGATGGQVEVGMGTFTFGVGPSKIIRNGELAETVRGVVISGFILETLKTIDAVGKDLTIRTSIFGGCGKMGQTVRVGFGGPHVRVRKMTVGGR